MRVDVEADEHVRARGLLLGVVGSAVGYRSDLSSQPLHRGLPSPWLTVVFSLAGPVVCRTSLDQPAAASRHHALVGGLHPAPVFIAGGDRQVGIQLAVHPLAARTLFGVPLPELGPVLDAEALWGRSAEALRLQLLESESWAGRFAAVRAALRARLNDSPDPGVRPEVVEAWRWLSVRRGRAGMDQLAGHVALSGRQLRTLFAREVGMGPKSASRLMRFAHATQRITASVADGRTPDLARTAAECGYADHAHLDGEFAQFAGTSPSGWLAEERRNLQAGGQRPDAEWGHD